MLTELILITALRFHQPHDGRFTFLNACSAKGTMMFISISQMPRGILMYLKRTGCKTTDFKPK